MTLKLNGTNSEAAPAYAGDDADTGLQCGTNELKLVTGGSARATIDSSGRLLVGATSSTGSHILEVNGGTDNEPIKVESSDVGAYIRFEDDDTTGSTRIGAVDNDFKIDVNSAERIRIKSDAKIGFNTAIPPRDFCFHSGQADTNIQITNNTTGIDDSAGSLIQQDGNNLYIWNKENSFMSLGTNAREQVRIDANGYVTIKKNPSNNTCRLSFNHVNSTRIEYSDQSGDLSFYTNSAARVKVGYGGGFLPVADNSQSLGTSPNRWTAVYAVNGTIQTSDEREKTSITTSTLGINFIKQLRPVSYKWTVGENIVTKAEDGETDVITPRPGERTHWGFIAQEVKQAADTAGVDFGGWVLGDKDDPGSSQGLRYDQFIAPLTKALQEAIAEIETLKTKVAALEGAS